MTAVDARQPELADPSVGAALTVAAIGMLARWLPGNRTSVGV